MAIDAMQLLTHCMNNPRSTTQIRSQNSEPISRKFLTRSENRVGWSQIRRCCMAVVPRAASLSVGVSQTFIWKL